VKLTLGLVQRTVRPVPASDEQQQITDRPTAPRPLTKSAVASSSGTSERCTPLQVAKAKAKAKRMGRRYAIPQLPGALSNWLARHLFIETLLRKHSALGSGSKSCSPEKRGNTQQLERSNCLSQQISRG